MAIQWLLTTCRARMPSDWAVCLATTPSDPRLAQFTKFDADPIFQLGDLLASTGPPDRLVLLIPEVLAHQAEADLAAMDRVGTLGKDVRVNVLVQNIDLLDVEPIVALSRRFRTTATTAHEKYATEDLASRLNVPVSHLGVLVGPQRYTRWPMSVKEDVMLVSPDENPVRRPVLRRLHRTHPGLRFKVVRRLPYPAYLDLVRRARWAITFGEGLDGYFVETVFSGGVAFAAFNTRFFTSDFQATPGVFPSMEALEQGLPALIDELQDPERYKAVQQAQFDVCAKHYDTAAYLQRVERLLTALGLK